MRLDDLAREAGVATTTVRLYQNKGLLPGPRLVGRTGFYDETHLGRLRLIGQLQDRGFSLASIRHMLETRDSGADLDALLGPEAGTEGSADRSRQSVVPAEELLARLPESARTPEMLQRAADLRLVELLDDGTIRIPDSRFLDTGTALVALGVPTDVVLDEWAELVTHTDAIADRFVALFEQHVLDADTDAATITSTLRQLRVIARDVVAAALERSIAERARDRLDQLATPSA